MTPEEQEALDRKLTEAKQIQATLERANFYSSDLHIAVRFEKPGVRIDMVGSSNSYLMTITDQDLITALKVTIDGVIKEKLSRLQKRYEQL